MKHFGEKVNLWVQYRCSLSHTPFSCSVTDSLLWRFPCHCIHTYISLRPNPPPSPTHLKKKKKSTRLNFPFPWLPCDKNKPFQGNKYWSTSSKAEAYPGKTSEKCTPPPPTPTQAEWSEHRTRNTAPWFESRSGHWLDFQLFSVVLEFTSSATLGNSQLVASCQLGFLILLCCIWILCFFVNYLSGLPVN